MILPTDVWLKILEECGAEEIVCLSRCCKNFHELTKSRNVWLRTLYRLDQYEAPVILPHVPTTSYDAVELRRIVINARKSARNLEKDSNDSSHRTVKYKREVRIPLAEFNLDEVLGEALVFGLELILLPGCKQLLVLWPAGYLQVWDISAQEPRLLWLHPDYPEGPPEERPLLLSILHFELQEDGDINLLLVNDLLQDDLLGERYIDIVRVSPDSGDIQMLKSGKESYLDREHGPPEIVRLCGDISAVYQEFYATMMGALTISLWRDDLSLILTEAALDSVELTEDYLICTRRVEDGKKSIAVISIEDVSERLRTKGSSTMEIEKVFSLEHPLEYDSFAGQRALLSLCTYHWRPKAMRDKMSITVTADVRMTFVREGVFIAHFSLIKGEHPSLELLNSGMWKFASTDNRVVVEDRLMSILPGWYSPCHVPIVFHNIDSPDENDILKLASLSLRHDMTLETSDLDVDSVVPLSIRSEFYTGSLVYATKNYDSAVIKKPVSQHSTRTLRPTILLVLRLLWLFSLENPQ